MEKVFGGISRTIDKLRTAWQERAAVGNFYQTIKDKLVPIMVFDDYLIEWDQDTGRQRYDLLKAAFADLNLPLGVIHLRMTEDTVNAPGVSVFNEDCRVGKLTKLFIGVEINPQAAASGDQIRDAGVELGKMIILSRDRGVFASREELPTVWDRKFFQSG